MDMSNFSKFNHLIIYIVSTAVSFLIEFFQFNNVASEAGWKLIL